MDPPPFRNARCNYFFRKEVLAVALFRATQKTAQNVIPINHRVDATTRFTHLHELNLVILVKKERQKERQNKGVICYNK